MRGRCKCSVWTILSLFGGTPLQADEPFFSGMGHLSSAHPQSRALAVSGDGLIAVGWSRNDADKQDAVRWDEMEGLQRVTEEPFDRDRVANGVSLDGDVISGERPGWRWTPDAGFMWVEGVSEGKGLSSNGEVFVGYALPGGGRQEAVFWTVETGAVLMGDLPGGDVQAIAWDASRDGSVIVGQGKQEKNYRRAFRWTQESGMVELNPHDGNDQSRALAVSDDGTVVVGQYTPRFAGPNEAFHWRSERGIVRLKAPDGFKSTVALGVSPDGSVIVGAMIPRSGEGSRANIWTDGCGLQDLQELLECEFELDLSGWQLRQALDVAEDNRTIVGWGINPDGEEEGWIARLSDVLGDMDCDGCRDLTDIEPFILALLDPDEYQQRFPECRIQNGDTNRDGSVDLADVDGFVDLLLSECP